jgi:hypothetical protein
MSDGNKPLAKDQGTASPVIAQIEAYEKKFEKWTKRGAAIVKRYRDERNEAGNAAFVDRRFNILWSNTETLRPTLYARLPKVQVERRFKDADPVARLACEIAERTGNYILETSAFGDVLEDNVEDYLLPGRGTMWIHYDVEGEETEIEGEYEEDGETPKTEFKKISETITPTYVDWRDFGHEPKRHWQEVKRVWRRVYKTRKELIERFGKTKGNRIDLDRARDEAGKFVDNVTPQATIYEVWDKGRGKVCWVHKDEKDYLDEIDPPVDIESFWPCAKPLYATMTNGSLVPVPDFALYQDQASELDKITNRIARLTDALKLVGVYNASIPELQRILHPNGTPDNTMVPVKDWAQLTEKGGIQAGIQFIPIADVAAALLNAYQAREQVLNVIYQITGISDLLRGASDPRETATAQGIKGQFGTTRIKARQGKVANFARDNARIVVEIAVEMFEPQTLWEMTNASSFCQIDPQVQQVLQQTGQQPEWTDSQEFIKALELLRNDKLRSFRVDIETDSTIALDEDQDKENVVEFLGALSTFIQGWGAIVAQSPQLLPLAKEALLYATRRYKAGRALETAIEQAMDALAQAAQQPKPPSPEQQKAHAQIQQGQQKMQIQQQKAQLDAQGKQQELAFKREEHAQDLQFEREKFGMEMQQDQAEHAQNMAQAEQDAAFRRQQQQEAARRQNVVQMRR